MGTIEFQLTERPLPPVTGSIGITQGGYGDRGNLELVAPDPDDGFWVFWFNGDALEHRSGAARGHWSAGLHVRTGSRLLSTRIAQVPFGPNFLEVVGRVESGILQRWYWTPSDGFLAGGTVASTAGGEPARLVASADRLTTMRVDDAGVEVLTSDVARYPALRWHSRGVPVDGIAASVDIDMAPAQPDDDPPLVALGLGLVVVDARAHLLRAVGTTEWRIGAALPGQWRTAQIHILDRTSAVLTGHDTEGRPVIAAVTVQHHPGGSTVDVADTFVPADLRYLEGTVDDIAACLSTLPAPLSTPARACTLEVVMRTGTELHHLRYDARTLRPYRAVAGAVRARVWH